jgi:hypothetical protein
MATTGPARGWDGHDNQGGVVAVETARCGGCHGRSSGPVVAAGGAAGLDDHGNQGGVVAATAAETTRCGGSHGRGSGPVVAAGSGP